MEDGDLGHAYWHSISQLLKRTAVLEQENQALRCELDEHDARQSQKPIGTLGSRLIGMEDGGGDAFLVYLMRLWRQQVERLVMS